MERAWGLPWAPAVMAAGLCATAPAVAVESLAEITNFRIQVIDLDLQDGVAAGYSFSDAATLLNASALTGQLPAVVDVQVSNDWTSAIQAMAVDGTATGSAQAGDGFLRAAGTASEPLASYYVETRRTDEGFTIFPNTRLVFTADFHSDVSEFPCTAPACTGLTSDMHFRLYQRAEDGQETTAASFSLQTYQDGGPELQEHMNISFATGVAPWQGNVDMLALTSGGLPIPEPQGWALLAAGLAGLALLRVRRAVA
jgi:hypothetical protein